MKETRVIVAGGRDFRNYKLLCNRMDQLSCEKFNGSVEVVCGKAKGADTLGEKWGIDSGHSVKYFPADWDGLGKAAGHIRNKQMGDYATHLVAFWDGISKGTKGMIDYARGKGIEVDVVGYLKPPVVVNRYKEPFDVYIGRGSPWGNPYTVEEFGREQYISMYRKFLWDSISQGVISKEDILSLSGARLGCFCKPKACHGDVIVSAFYWAEVNVK